MLKLGLDEKWVQLSMETICTATYSVLINGEPKGFVTPTRAIKQGDSLSPYLFLLCAEGLSAMIRKAKEARNLQGVLSSNGGVYLSHLLFTDDSLIFCQATMEECQRLLAILKQYEAASGQAINRQKTTLFFSRNTRIDVKQHIRNMMGARIMEDCEKYLGLPMASRKSKVNTFKDLQEKITRRVMGWKEKLISKAGREILIKTVAQAISTYSMCIFKIPKTLCDTINSTMAKYWWGQTEKEKKIHWINWKKLCSSKAKGGMGFRDIQAFNLALLAKQVYITLTPRGVCGLVGAVFFQIYYRTDRDRFFYNWNRCTPPKVGFSTYSGAVFCSRFGQFEILKKKTVFFNNKKLGFQAQYQYINLFKISSKYKEFFLFSKPSV